MTPLPLLFAFSAAYLAYHFVSDSARIRAGLGRRLPDADPTLVGALLQRGAGVVFLGIIPWLFVLRLAPLELRESGPGWNFSSASLLWSLGLSIAVAILNFFEARRPEAWRRAPRIRAENWSLGLFAANALSWAAYLFAFELLFRGFLLFALRTAFGPGPAIVIDTAAYSLVHVPKGLRQSLGAVPFGALLCALTLGTGAIWIAVLSHLALALSHDHFALRANPAMRYAFKKSGGGGN